MGTKQVSSIILTVSAASLSLLLACSDSAAPVGDPVEIPTLACLEAGVNADPFTVADALVANGADHEDQGDYTWDTTAVVGIAFSGSSITVTGTGATVSGTTVTISKAGTYRISGTLDSGQIVVKATDTSLVRLVLNGMTITNPGNAAIVMSKVLRAVIILADGTVNRVTDGNTYPAGVDQNAAIFSKSDVSIGGNGSLIVTGRYNDGIASKDGLVIHSGTITVTAVDDGIRGKDYLVIRGGTVRVTSGGDGLKSDEDADSTLGYVLVEGGAIEVDAANDGIQAATDALIAGGTLVLRTGGGSSVVITDTALSAKGIKGDSAVVVDGGALTINSADDGLHTGRLLVVNGGTITIATGDDGAHSDVDLTINGGDLTVTKSYEGIENKQGDMTINGGHIRVTSSDDGINVAGAGAAASRPGTPAGDYWLYVNGGFIASNATGDGVDVNGSIVMTGGCLLVHGPTRNDNGALDYDGSFKMTGGYLVAAGSSGMAQAPGSSSTQVSVLLSFVSARLAGTPVHVQSADGVGIFDFVPARAYQSVAVSSPLLARGETYRVYFGGTATGTATDGLYQGGTYTPGTLAASFTAAGVVNRVSF